MGIPMSLDVPGVRREEVWGLVADAFEVLHAANRRFTRLDPRSEVSRYARGEIAPAQLSGELLEVLAVAERAAADSGGAFSVRRPDGSLDTDGVVKGWAAQRAVDVLRQGGLVSFCLNAGGDVAAAGEPEAGRGWNVGVRDPADAQRMLAVLEVRDGAVATSGLYERGTHVWDGRTGQAATGLLSATVVAADLMTADVLATTVLALGPGGVEWACAHGAVAVLAVRPDGQVLSGGAAREAALA